MTLADWLEATDKTSFEVARALGIGESHFARLKARKTAPSLHLARQIIELSRGRIKLEDLERLP